MMRASAPRLDIFAEALRSTWQELANSGDSLASQFQTHRFSGTDEDRAAGVAWIGKRIAPSPDPDRVMVTNGTMNSILLLTSSLVGPGNVILTEELTFPIAYTLTKIAAAQVQAVQIDDVGMIPEDFEKKCIAFKPKAVYVNSTIHSPTAYVMPTERREEIARIARHHGVQIIEDEAQALYLDETEAPNSFATIAPDITWYMMGLSKYLSLGVRMAYVVAPSREALATVLERIRPVTTWHVAPIIATIVTQWIETGRAQELFNAARTEVHKRQAIVSEILSSTDGYRGSSGIHFWLQAPKGISSVQFSQAIGDAGVIVRPSRLYSGDHEPRFQGIRPAVGEPSDLAETRQAVEVLRDVRHRLAVQNT
jgi:DNA-binding transcriptional MocR family regulator